MMQHHLQEKYLGQKQNDIKPYALSLIAAHLHAGSLLTAESTQLLQKNTRECSTFVPCLLIGVV